MGGLSLWHWVIVALVILILFGRGKISETMGDFGKGVKSFRKGLSEEDAPRSDLSKAPPPQIANQTNDPGTQANAETPARDADKPQP
jgi:sec-independent protein translocase protein TatA